MIKLYRTSIVTLLALSTGTTLSLAQGITPPKSIPTKQPAIKVSPEEMRKEISYGLGFQNGEQYAQHGFVGSDLDKDAYVRGILEAIAGDAYSSEPGKFDAAMRAFDELVRNREMGHAKKNAEEEKAFLEKNGKRDGVITTKTGLQYQILTKGSGKTYSPPAGTLNNVDPLTEFHVISSTTLLDGSTLRANKGNQVERYSLQVIQGLAEALRIMPVGSKWRLYVPSKLAFAGQRYGAKVSPNSMIIYELELKDIVVRKAPPQPQR